MTFAIISFLVAFILLGSALLLIFYRDNIQERISSALYPRANKKSISSTIQETRHVIGGVVEQFEKILPRSQAEIGVVQQRLVRAGMRGENSVKMFYGAKVITPTVLLLLAWATGAYHLAPLFIFALAGGIGFLAPDFWLGRKISNRQAEMKKGLPDVLDLLVICVEAGLSLDQATREPHKSWLRRNRL